jgi:glycosyltransferase involved in cell wall biosynthesis
MSPTLSVIMATYNRENLVIQTLNSIKNQTYKDFECIIVDDQSTDNTFNVISDFIKSDNRFTLYSRPNSKSKGMSGSRNYGYALSNGQYVNWFDDDDIMHPECLEKKMSLILEKELDFVSCEIAYFNDSIDEYEKIENDYDLSNIFQNYFKGSISFYSICSLWKKSFLDENSFVFNEDNKLLVDWVFNINVLFTNPKYSLIKEVLTFYRRHEKSISGKLASYNESYIFQEYQIRSKMFEIFKSKNLVNKQLNLWYGKRLVFLLRALLLKNDSRSNKILLDILKVNNDKDILLLKIRTLIGFFTYKTFKKGYKFLSN